ncbi:MAG: hypothetical protein IJ733_01025 [Lachnospiraceae bacterium]|nr:hypothetical protein [Lachnospiraceae bacterium]
MSDVNNMDSKLSDDALEGVSGGYIFYANGCQGSDPNRQWEVINDKNGDVIERFGTKEDAMKYAESIGESDEQVPWETVNKLRNPGQQSQPSQPSQPGLHITYTPHIKIRW